LPERLTTEYCREATADNNEMYTWLMQGAKLAPVDETRSRYRLGKNEARCDFHLVADTPFEAAMGVSTANDHSRLLGWQQLQAKANAAAGKFEASTLKGSRPGGFDVVVDAMTAAPPAP